MKVRTKVKAGDTQWSDHRYKKNIEMLSDALSTVMQLRGVRFQYRADEFPDQDFPHDEQIGFIAQEVAELLPQVVCSGEDGFLSVGYSHIVPVLVEAIKDQQQMIDEQHKRVLRLEETIQRLI